MDKLIIKPGGIVSARKVEGEWRLRVLGAPNGGSEEGNVDRHGERFTERTNYHIEIGESRPVFAGHGDDQEQPQVIGRATAVERDEKGLWFDVVLDKTKDLARGIWEAAKEGFAVASSGSISYLIRRAGREILSWPIAELSLLDKRKQTPANDLATVNLRQAFAKAQIDFPEAFAEVEEVEAGAVEFEMTPEREAAIRERMNEILAEREEPFKPTAEDLDRVRNDKMRLEAMAQTGEMWGKPPVELAGDLEPLREWVQWEMLPGWDTFVTTGTGKKHTLVLHPYDHRQEFSADHLDKRNGREGMFERQQRMLHAQAERVMLYGLMLYKMTGETLEWFDNEGPVPEHILDSIEKAEKQYEAWQKRQEPDWATPPQMELDGTITFGTIKDTKKKPKPEPAAFRDPVKGNWWTSKQAWLDSLTPEEREKAFELVEERKKKLKERAKLFAEAAAAAKRTAD